MGLLRSRERALDPTEALEEVGDRLREELDYTREAAAMRLYRRFFADRPDIRVPETMDELCTLRLLTMTWLEGDGLLAFKDAPLETRNRIARLLFDAWWRPMTTLGVIHGDPHLGNYALTPEAAELNLLDFGCVRIFPPRFVAGVVRLYRALFEDDREGQRAAYAAWGFESLTDGLMDALNMWPASSTARSWTTACAPWRTGWPPATTVARKPSASATP